MERAKNLRKMLNLMQQCSMALRYIARKDFTDDETIELYRLAELNDEINRRMQVMINLLETENGSTVPPTRKV